MTGSPDYFSVVRTQRAHRAFTAEAVPDELVERVLEAATYAPSAENTQPWAFIVVRDDAARGRIGELNRQAWESGGRDFSRPRLSPEVFAKLVLDRGWSQRRYEAWLVMLVAAMLDRELG